MSSETKGLRLDDKVRSENALIESMQHNEDKSITMYALIFALTVREYFWAEAAIPPIVVVVTVLFLLLNLRGASQSRAKPVVWRRPPVGSVSSMPPAL